MEKSDILIALDKEHHLNFVDHSYPDLLYSELVKSQIVAMRGNALHPRVKSVIADTDNWYLGIFY